MTEREQRIWDAAYAAAFVMDWAYFYTARGTEYANKNTRADGAREVADLAIARHREHVATHGDEHDFTIPTNKDS